MKLIVLFGLVLIASASNINKNTLKHFPSFDAELLLRAPNGNCSMVVCT